MTAIVARAMLACGDALAGLARDGVPNGEAIMVEGLLVWLIVGAIAGWLAGLIVKGYGFGLIGNIVVGIIGAVIAGWLLPKLGISLGPALLPPSSTP